MKLTGKLFFFLFLGFAAQAQKTYLHCGQLIDCRSGGIQQEMTIVVEGNTIVDITKGYTGNPGEDNIINLRSETVMPGLTDMHVHIEGETGAGSYAERFRLNPADVALRATTYAEKTLMAGFTTVRDMGGTGVNVALRDAIEKGYVKGPRIFTAEKSLASTGGHADPSNGVRRELMGDPGPAEGVINGIEDARKAVRQRYKNGADCIKITATGGVTSVSKNASGPHFTIEEITAIVETARDYNFHVAAHAHGPEGMKRAVLAGVTTIEHGTMMTPEIMDLMIEKGTYLVPTISAGKYAISKVETPGFYPAIIIPKILEVVPFVDKTYPEAFRRGVKVAFGTDAGVSPHGENAKEFEYMVDAGMDPMEAILSATVVPASILKVSDKQGTLEKGKVADIIAVPGNPLEDITVMSRVNFVMKSGMVFKAR
jgi:imidazolonepropionase-like amidohydrolase